MEENEIETIGIRGEYWFDEHGNSVYADGDNGDMNHEAHVIQRCATELLDMFNVDSSGDHIAIEHDSPEEQEILQEIIDDLSEEERTDEIIESIKNDPADAIINYLINSWNYSQQKANDLVLTAYGSMRDAREYAIKNWGWSRVHGDSIECQKLNAQTLKNIASGINDAIESEGLFVEYMDNPEVLEQHEYIISTYTGKRYVITLADMEQGNVSGLEQDITVKNTAAKDQLKKMDVDAMSDFYKNKGIIGDSVNFKTFFLNRSKLFRGK